MNRESPPYAAQKCIPPIPANHLPHLTSSSVIMWAAWQEWSNFQTIKGLRWWLSISITNEPTRRIIKRALDNAGKLLVPYPGEFIFMATDEAQAILGSPNGLGLGYFLIQHKSQPGNMYVSGVVVYHGDTMHQSPCLAFAVMPPAATAPGQNQGSAVADSRVPSPTGNLTSVCEELERREAEAHGRRNKHGGGPVQVH
ncbi:hypothetical protein K458DRAFT_387098 [Lentithecium fluviatile CBS 122367]|uniref:Uncharacterized protein n=1 Tax=Lentithecium fluviatile CBS 122367 TaxID=1168545 RepID=A0A6G1J6E9_9PLEO|nr:hypothetical protein K458DRAFT_387098 [Lentithecium fluviatile CBS 122367]